MKIILLRHCETDYNKLNILQGKRSYVLNENGIKRANQIAKELKGMKVVLGFTSPVTRARQTAELVMDNYAIIDDRLANLNLGKAEGLNKDKADMLGILPNPTIYAGVEDADEFIARIQGFVEEVEALNPQMNDDSAILICSHKSVLGAIKCMIEGKSLYSTNWSENTPAIGQYEILNYQTELERE